MIQWQKCIGGSAFDEALETAIAPDGTIYVVGSTSSSDIDSAPNHGSADILVAKLSSTGALLGTKCLGGSSTDVGYGIAVGIGDDGKDEILITGYTMSNDGDVSGKHGGTDVWVATLDDKLGIKSQKCLGGSAEDVGFGIIVNGNDIYVSGYTASNDGDVSGNHGGADVWLMKLDKSLNLVLQKCFGGPGDDRGHGITMTADRSIYIAGYASANGGDINNNHGTHDMWVVKTNPSLTLDAQKCLGGSSKDAGWKICNLSSPILPPVIYVTGRTLSNDGDVSGNHGGFDAWTVALDPSLTIQKQQCIGGSSSDFGLGITATNILGQVAICGSAYSNDGDIITTHGAQEGFLTIRML